MLNNGGQSVEVGTVPNTSIYAQGSTGTITAAHPLTITAQSNQEQLFLVVNSGNPSNLYSFSSVVENGSINLGYVLGVPYVKNVTQAPSCPQSTSLLPYQWIVQMDSRGFGALTGTPTFIPVVRVCFYKNIVGQEFGILRKDQLFSSNLTLSSNGTTRTLNIGSNNQSVSFDNLISAKWVGNYESGIGTVEASAFVAISHDSTWTLQNMASYNNWITNNYNPTQGLLVSQTYTYQTYQQNPLIAINSCSSLEIGNATYMNSNYYLYQIGTCLNQYASQSISQNNGALNSTLLTSTSVSPYGSSPAVYNPGYNNSQAFLVNIPTAFTSSLPVLDLDINGTFLGVLIPEGIPRIISINASPFSSGSNGTIKMQVENIGNSQGTFYTSLINCGGVVATTSQKYPVPAGQTQEIDIPIYSSGVTKLNAECTVIVTDYNSYKNDSKQVNIVIRPPNQCTPNSQIVNGESICPCLNVSGVWTIGSGSACTTCNYGVISNGNGGSTCASAPVTAQTTIGQQQTSQTTTIAYNTTLGPEDVIIVTIGSRLNEDSTYKSTLSSYENLLTSEGLSYKYIELDQFNPNMNPNDWTSVKSTINKIEYETNPQYLIILGSTNIVPMPNVSTNATFDWSNENPNEIPTDDPYGTTTNSTIPTIVVARIPGQNADQIAEFLNNDLSRHSNPNNKLFMMSVGLSDIHDSFIKNDTNMFSLDTTGASCSPNNNCFYAPPNCLQSSSGYCTNSSSMKTAISNVYGIQYYNCHGDGNACVDYYGNLTLIDGSILPKLNTNPIIIVGGCYDATLTPISDYTNPLSPPLLATQALSNGAAIYIGNTKWGYGYLTPTEQIYIYNQFKSGETIGQAFLSMKQKFLTNPYDPYQEGTAHELQLYGDPTMSMS